MGTILTYQEDLTKAMTWLAGQPDTIFLGQQVRYPGNAIYGTLSGVPTEKRIEMPVAEDMQLGISIGMALVGKVPITIYPRMDFLLCATNQLVNHLDKYPSHVIIRVCVGSKAPMNPGPQHCGDYTSMFARLLNSVCVYVITEATEIVPTYKEVYANRYPVLVIEYADLYGME